MSCSQYNKGTKVHKAYWSTVIVQYVHDGKVEEETLKKLKVDYPHVFEKTQEELQKEYQLEHQKWLARKNKKIIKKSITR